MKVTNNSGISLPLAVWLLHDEYDYVDKENYFSVTTLMRPLKQIVLPHRIPVEQRTSDVEDYIARALGHSIHDSIEKAWIKGKNRCLALLGYSQVVIDKILVNPTQEELIATPGAIAVYLEQRAYREITVNGVVYTVGGKYDMVADGIVQDNKSTSAYSWLYGTRDDDHRFQLSSYRWLNPDKITADYGSINYIFTDWSKAAARSNPKYPQKRVENKELVLLPPAQIERIFAEKIALIRKYWNAPESDMPMCTDEELWRSEPQYKYFSDPEKAKEAGARCTKKFDNLADANKYKAEKGKGIVITVPGEVKACGYCPAFEACKQKDLYLVGSE